MSDIEALKEQARRHEQQEEWQQACDLYVRALARAGEDREPEIGLHNRVGDLQIRLGSLDDAVRHFEKAVDLYLEAGLPNNAIAVCKKLLRHLPQHLATHRRMSQIRASQGFLLDARGHVLTYAEQMQAAGNTEEALEALVQFADMAPEDSEIRMSVALQLLQHDRPDDAMQQLLAGYRIFMGKGDESGAAPFQEKILALDPEADLAALPDVPAESTGMPSPQADGDTGAAPDLAFETTALGGAAHEEGLAGFGAVEVEGNEVSAVSDDPGVESMEEPRGSDPEPEAEDAVVPVAPQADESETLAGDLPLISMDDDDARPEPAGPSPETGLSQDTGPAPDMGATPGAATGADAASRSPLEDWELLRGTLSSRPADRSEAEDLLELAFQLGDPARVVESYLVLSEALRRGGDAEGALGVLEQVLALDPDNARAREGLAQGGEAALDEEGAPEHDEPASDLDTGDAGRDSAVEAGGGFVDLGALVFDEPRGEGTTRFTVEYEEPSGDENADFSRVLDQFKAKVSENFDHEDVRAHHDLGTAYKEMGLLGEAVEKFQEALRAAPGHLPTYELLGQVFMEQGEDRAAVRVLERALRIPTLVEDDFLGIYYYLARAHEKLGDTREAVDFYDRVFALDINFADVTDRLRRLR